MLGIERLREGLEFHAQEEKNPLIIDIGNTYNSYCYEPPPTLTPFIISRTEREQTNYKSSFSLIVFLSFLSLSTLLLRDKRRNILLGNWVIASLNKELNKHVRISYKKR